MGKIEKITYYSFGWFIVFLLNWGKWGEIPRWFWAVGFHYERFGYTILWLGVVTFAWWKGKLDGWSWNID